MHLSPGFCTAAQKKGGGKGSKQDVSRGKTTGGPKPEGSNTQELWGNVHQRGLATGEAAAAPASTPAPQPPVNAADMLGEQQARDNNAAGANAVKLPVVIPTKRVPVRECWR